MIKQILLEITIDDDLEAKANFKALSKEEQAKQLANFSIYKTLSAEQRTEAAHALLGVLGLIPVIGEPADLADALLYIQENNYVLAAISFICLIPAIGTAVGVARKSTKVIPAKLVFEYADEIEELVAKIAPNVAGGPEIAKAVEKLLENVKMSSDFVHQVVDLETGQTRYLIDAPAPASTWFNNPKMLEWFKKFARSSLTDTLNSIGTDAAREKFVTKYIKYAKEQAANYNLTPADLETFRFTLDEYGADAYTIFPKIVDSLSNIKIKLSIASPPEAGALASYVPLKDEIIVYLPGFTKFIKNPAKLKDELIATLDHEMWHAIDDRIALSHSGLNKSDLGDRAKDLYAVGNKGIYQSSRYLGSSSRNASPGLKGPMDKLISSFNIPELGKSYFTKPTEIFVRIRALKKYLKKEDVLLSDLKKFADMRKEELPNDDLETIWTWLQDIPDDAMKEIADAIDFF